MRVAVDARELCGRPTGVGRYLRELLLEWSVSRDARRHEWLLYAPAGVDVPSGLPATLRVLAGSGGTWWEQWTLGRALAGDRPDVLFAPGYSAPFTAPCPVVVAIHDVSFAAHPEWYATREGSRRRLITRWSARRARIILTLSQFSKREIVTRLQVPEARVRVTYLSHRPIDGPIDSLAKEPLVLYVGTVFPRRHVRELILAFVLCVAPVTDARLEIVGEHRMPGSGSLGPSLDSLPADLRARVAIRSYVDEAALRDLYRRCRVFVFLSEYEGFGLTPLEALSAGAVPVVLDTEVAREIYGDAASYLAPGPDLADRLGARLVELLSRAETREAILRHRSAVVSRYDWARTAADTLAAIEDAAGAR
jgi:glycosyltransferase involved in cell wall biosynthesis